MRTRFAAFVVFAASSLTGCGTPYQARGFRGGYEDYQAGAGTVMVSFKGNGYTSQSDVTRMWHRRAAEVCGGADKYVVVDIGPSADVTQGASTTTTNVNIVGDHAYAMSTTQPGMRWTRHLLEGTIRCVNGGSYDPNRSFGD